MESWNAAFKGTCLRPGPRTTDTKAGGPKQALFPNTGRQRPGVITTPVGVASSGLHIYRLFLTGVPRLQGIALLLIQ